MSSHPFSSSLGSVPEKTAYTVSDLAGRIRGAVEEAFPSRVWVAGEVANLTRSNAGHIYLDLLERVPEDSGEEQALLPAVIWESRRPAINQALRKANWGRVSDGDEIKVRVGVEFYPPQGRISLRIYEVDPQYTLSRWKKERERVVALLRREGIFEDNRRLRLSAAPNRVGLVTSEGSNAHADFLATLNESGLGWQVEFHHSGVQGDAAKDSLAEALNRLSELRPDVICIVRGGGSTTDLAVFDHVEVARAITRCPVPVITGIGHELDRTVSDLVAYRSERTPTACAAWLVGQVRAFADRVHYLGGEIAEVAHGLVGRHRRHLDSSPFTMASAVVEVLVRCRRRFERSVQLLPAYVLPRLQRDAALVASRHSALVRESRQGLRLERTRLETARKIAEAHDPQRNLARGWSITRRRSGGVISSIAGVHPAEVIETRVSDGTLISTVSERRSHRGAGDAEEGRP